MRREYWICLALAALTVIVFVQVLGFDYVNFDDPAYITDNPHVVEGLNASGVQWALTTGYQANWHPLTWLSLMLDTSLHGVNPRGYHLTNLLLHLLNTVLLFWVLRLMTGVVWRSAVVAALFAVHPLHVESVAWITERKDVLSMFWGLLAIWAYAAYARSGRARTYVLSAICLALSLMAKALFITLPFLFLLLDYWPLGRIRGFGPASGSSAKPRPLAALALEKLPLLGLGAAVAVATFLAQGRYGAVTETAAVPRGLLAANAVVSYVRYLWKMIWPLNLSILYPHPNMEGGTPWAAWQVAGAGLLLLGLSWLVYRYRRWRWLTVGWLWYLGTLVPMIGIVQVGSQAMADRYTYLPLIGLFIILAWGGDLLLNRPVATGRKAKPGPRASGAARVVTLVGIALCAGSAWQQTTVWRNSLTLGEHAVTVGPTGPKMTYNYALALSEAARFAEAVPQYDATIRMMPDHSKAHNNRGRTLQMMGRLPEGIASIKQAIRIEPDFELAYVNLAVAELAAGHVDAAIAARQAALRLNPNNPSGHNTLGSLLGRAGRLDEAIAQFRLALQLKPDYTEARQNLKLAEGMKNQPGSTP
jgi:Flp pilus assembly protein TadD